MGLTGEHLNYGRVLRLSAMRYRDRPALEIAGTAYTFGELDRQVNAMASALAARGVVAGSRILLFAPNGADYVRVMFAAAKLGAVCVPTSTALTERDLAFVLDATQPRLVAHSVGYRDRVLGGLELATLTGQPVVIELVADSWAPAIADGPDPDALDPRGLPDDEPPAAGVADNDPAILLFTSGSMGTPKAVVKSYANVTWHAINRQISEPRREGARELFVLPLGGVGFGNFLLTDVMVGATCVLEPVFDSGRASDLLADGRIDYAFLAPTMMMAIDTAAPGRSYPAVQVVETAYEVTGAQRRRIAEMFPDARILYSYGCTEGSMARAPEHAFLEDPTNVGFASGLDEYRVVDQPESTEMGAIEVSGPTVMQGYLTTPGEPPSDVVRDGWFDTGDLGWIDAAGALHFGGRHKDMIKSGAVNVFAWDVESGLASHPDVAGVAVIGVPDDYWGEAVVAVVEPRDGADLTLESLREHAEEHLAGFRRPKAYYLADRLPVNATGKLAKGEVRAMVAGGSARPLAPSTAGRTDDTQR